MGIYNTVPKLFHSDKNLPDPLKFGYIQLNKKTYLHESFKGSGVEDLLKTAEVSVENLMGGAIGDYITIIGGDRKTLVESFGFTDQMVGAAFCKPYIIILEDYLSVVLLLTKWFMQQFLTESALYRYGLMKDWHNRLKKMY